MVRLTAAVEVMTVPGAHSSLHNVLQSQARQGCLVLLLAREEALSTGTVEQCCPFDRSESLYTLTRWGRLVFGLGLSTGLLSGQELLFAACRMNIVRLRGTRWLQIECGNHGIWCGG